ncbi:zinc finger protein CONSTANS-LIKE 4 [Ricinus communis]|uniref:Salt-tolerance protein, putative n=1 Tax=Ricinus communis TaxID=3988 RepID=B9RNR3_RICCO|nr:zinc finger protein CONSTANS-LIKE 4 [Ricinus communis]EEF46831.1 Salt-tolerance protein, putative [Ricinus communis]|eukprot:XP_002515382.1 zinc finger protein CONSTANS-LIKE 4 [Ricinus communis]
MASKLCDSCKSATATLFCRPDSAFLCINCDSKIHAANKLASRHARVLICEVCEQAPAHVTCKADAAALCVTCDRDIHSANPLARRHERVPITPFYDSVSSVNNKPNAVNLLDDRYFSDVDGDAADVSREEAEAASWLLPNPPNTKLVENSDPNTGQYVFSDMDPYLDLDYGPGDPKLEAQEQNSSGTDGVVPVKSSKNVQAPFVNDNCFELDFTGSKPFPYGYNAQCLSNSVSSSSLDVGVVPDGGDISNPYSKSTMESVQQLSAVDREARVLRYREKRKNRKFEKTIRYASRKAYAETRPRIKGRFAKRTDIDVEADRSSSINAFGVVPSF